MKVPTWVAPPRLLLKTTSSQAAMRAGSSRSLSAEYSSACLGAERAERKWMGIEICEYGFETRRCNVMVRNQNETQLDTRKYSRCLKDVLKLKEVTREAALGSILSRSCCLQAVSVLSAAIPREYFGYRRR